MFRGHVAQWIARWTSDPEVVGSSPTVIVFLFLISSPPFSILLLSICFQTNKSYYMIQIDKNLIGAI